MATPPALHQTCAPAEGRLPGDRGPEDAESLQVRIHAELLQPTLIYLPGLHGDWTLVGSFRTALANRVRFVELTYPRTLTWSLSDYAAEIEKRLATRGIDHGWLLAESFGSQIGWEIIGRGRFNAKGLILAGGFALHPVPVAVRLASRLARDVPPPLMTRLLQLYARVFRLRYRRAPEVLAEMAAFLSRRTDLDRRAAKHRLDLIAQNDPRPIARTCARPVYALTGLFDPIVPWPPVRRWLRKNCPALRQHKIIWPADHTVLATAPGAAARQVMQWMET